MCSFKETESSVDKKTTCRWETPLPIPWIDYSRWSHQTHNALWLRFISLTLNGFTEVEKTQIRNKSTKQVGKHKKLTRKLPFSLFSFLFFFLIWAISIQHSSTERTGKGRFVAGKKKEKSEKLEIFPFCSDWHLNLTVHVLQSKVHNGGTHCPDHLACPVHPQ